MIKFLISVFEYTIAFIEPESNNVLDYQIDKDKFLGLLFHIYFNGKSGTIERSIKKIL